MKFSKWVGISGVLLIYIAAFLPWVWISTLDITVTGLKSAGTNFGKPALLNLIVSGVAAVLFYMPTVMAKRANLFFCAFNIAWSIRNYIILSTCRAGECPVKKAGLYLLVIASLIMVVAALFPDITLKEQDEEVNRENIQL